MPIPKPPILDEFDEGPEPTRTVFDAPRVKLVSSGSGLRFYAQLGAAARLMEHGFVVEEALGTSGGAIVSAAIASGMSPRELRENALRLEPKALLKPRLPVVTSVANALSSLTGSGVGGSVGATATPGTQGLFDNAPLLKALRTFLVGDFKSCIIPCHIATSNWTRKSAPVIWSTGDLPLCVMASMALPVFDMVEICGLLVEDQRTKVIYGFEARVPHARDRRKKPGVDDGVAPRGCLSVMPELYEDGGTSGNFWIDYDGWRHKTSAPVVGLRVRGSDEPCLRPKPKNKLERVVNTLSDLVDGQDREDAPSARVCYVETKFSGFDVSIDRDDIARMMQDGADSMDRFLNSALL